MTSTSSQKTFDKIKYTSTNKLEFDINDFDYSLVNSLRRIILSEIPNVAFRTEPHEKNDLEVKVNRSSLHNEFLCHRLGFIPICLEPKEIENFDKNKYNFVLKKKNTGDKILNITTNDIEVFDENSKKYPSTWHERVFPKNEITKDYILITKLKPNPVFNEEGEEIHIEGQLSKSIAKENSRWQPVCHCVYYNLQDTDQINNEIEKLILSENEKKQRNLNKEEKKKLINKFMIEKAPRYYRKNMRGEANSFHFEVESICKMTPGYLLKEAFNILTDKIDMLLTNLKPNLETIIEENQVTLKKKEGIKNCYDISVNDEDHTLGNLVQSLTFNEYIDEDNLFKEKYKMKYVGYDCPHPLENSVVMRYIFELKDDEEEDIDELIAIDFIKESLEHIKDKLQDYSNELSKKVKL